MHAVICHSIATRVVTAAGLAAVAAAALLAASPARGEPLRTDRPDFVESSATVGAGRFQVEAGVQAERDAADGVRTRTVTTPTLLRWGVASGWELRLESDGATRVRVSDGVGPTLRERGTADASFGVKWQHRDGDAAAGTPAVAWLLHVDVDSGSAPLRGQGARPSLRAVAEWELPDDVSVGVMPGLAWERDERGRFASGILAVTLGKGWTERWSTFVEVAGRQLARPAHGGNVVTLDLGTAWRLSDDVQLDLSVARGLNARAPDLAWGAGIAVRF